GNLPAGLSLSTGGALSGPPTTAGSAHFTIQVRDSASQTGSQAFSLTRSVAASGPCDLHNDGVVHSLDIQDAINHALGTSPGENADLMQTGQCNVVDVQRVINASLGGACLVGSGGPPAPPTVSVTAPQAGATVSGTVTVSANATSASGMSNV